LETLAITLPVFALAGLGWLGRRLGLLGPSVGEGLGAFVYWLAFPSLLLVGMAQAPRPDWTQGGHVGLYVGVLLAVQLLAHALGRATGPGGGFDAPARAGAALAASCGNTAFLGTAILVALDPALLALATAMVAVENVLVVGVAVALLRRAGGAQGDAAWIDALKGALNPVGMGALAGLVLCLTGWGLPDWLARPLGMLGAAASPAGLVALGVVLAGAASRPAGPAWSGIGLAVLLKCAALPAAMLAAFTLTGAPAAATLTAVTLAACPSAVNVFIQARQAGVWAAPAAMAVAISTLVSIVGVSVAVATLGRALP
jgi:predicted permease